MQMLKVDPEGFDELDRRLLKTMVDYFDGGPVGIESLAAALSEERGTLEDVVEPYLIQQGYLVRTARGEAPKTADAWVGQLAELRRVMAQPANKKLPQPEEGSTYA